MKVLRCDGCGVDIPDKDRHRITGQTIRPRGMQDFDWCALCTTVALTVITDYTPVVVAMRAAGLDNTSSALGLKAFLRDPLSEEDMLRLMDVGDQAQSAELLQRYGDEGWQVGRVVMVLAKNMEPVS